MLDESLADKLHAYENLLTQWQSRINLIGSGTSDNIYDRHILDSLQAEKLIPYGAAVADIGSGAGFPGLVLAIARSDIQVTLIEADAKKCAFLHAVSRETKVGVAIENFRIEKATQKMAAPDYISARALASLDKLLRFVGPWVTQGAKCLFWKGENFATEIAEARANGWEFDVIEHVSLTHPNARILELSHIQNSEIS